MAKLQDVTVWYVTLPNGKKVEIERSVAEQYFRKSYVATPFSRLKIHHVTKKVKAPAPASGNSSVAIATRKRKVVRRTKAKARKTVSRSRTKTAAKRKK